MTDKNTNITLANPQDEKNIDVTRRDFMVLTSLSACAVGGACALWPFISSMNPAADVLAESSAEYDLSHIQPGQNIVVKWRGKPIFIKRRTPSEIAEQRAIDINSLIDPETDEARVKPGYEEWLIAIGICTHLGCVPNVSAESYGGWLCPCHGSEYDASGRVRRGPAPKNLEIPPYVFLNDTKIKIG